VQQAGQVFGGQFAQRSAAPATESFGQRVEGIKAEEGAQVGERGIEFSAQGDDGDIFGDGVVAVPDDLEDDVAEGGIAVVAVVAPTGGAEVNFDVAGAGQFAFDLDESAAEIGSGFMIFEAGMKDAGWATV
jgi:hypothetical protein